MEVEWVDGSSSWLPLKELKGANTMWMLLSMPLIDDRIDEEPAFDW
jgi:hypothetical protein